MLDYVFALLFWLLYEALSWPMRLALQPVAMGGDLKRMLSRVAGPGMIALVTWVGAHFFLPLTIFTIWMWIVLFAGGAYLLCRAQGVRPDLLQVISPITNRRRWRTEAFVEVFGLVLFFAYLAFRRRNPEMTVITLNGFGSEKFGNAAIFWSAFHARSLPPDDYWLSGNPQAYYYFGHYFWAWVGRAGGFPGEWLITLGLSRLVALTWEAGYLLVRSFGLRPISSAVGAFFITWGGNPESVRLLYGQYNYTTGRMLEPPEQQGFAFAGRYLERWREADWNFDGYDFWRASRVIDWDHTVNEFPSWSMILGDFHAHHLSLPWIMGFVALVIGGDRWFGLRRRARAPPEQSGKKKKARDDAPPEGSVGYRAAVFCSGFVVLGILAAVANLWVAPLVAVAAFGIVLWRLKGGWRSMALRLAAVAVLGTVLLGCIVLSRGSLESPLATGPSAGEQASFLSQLPLKALPGNVRSPLTDLFFLWGFHVLPLLACVAAGVYRRRMTKAIGALLALGLALLLAKLLWLQSEPSLYWFALMAWVASLACGPRPWIRFQPAVIACATCFLLGGLELFYIPDRFAGTDLVRYNTYFKLGFPAWPMLGAAAWLGVMRLWRMGPPRAAKRRGTRRRARTWAHRWARAGQYAVRAALLAMIPFVMTMVGVGMPKRVLAATYGEPVKRKPTLDAFSWLIDLPAYSAEGRMLAWIRRFVPPRERVAEAAFHGAYGYQGRVASLGGRPVPLGWSHHEDQWRGVMRSGPLVAENMSRTAAIYNAATPEAMRAAADAAGVRWVVFGKSEIDHYGPRRAEQIYQVLRRAGRLRAKFPRGDSPKVFVFQIEAEAQEGGGQAAAQ